jgi:hypothetical protein
LQSIINVAHIWMPARNLSLLQFAVIMSPENAAQGHTMVEEEEAIMKNWQSHSSGSYHSSTTIKTSYRDTLLQAFSEFAPI